MVIEWNLCNDSCTQFERERDPATARAERAEAARDEWQQRWEKAVQYGGGILIERNAAEAAIERVRAHHVRIVDNTAPRLGFTAPDMCRADGETWPCPTIAALDSTQPDTPAPGRSGEEKPWPPTGYLCLLRGNDCPGHPSKWMVCQAPVDVMEELSKISSVVDEQWREDLIARVALRPDFRAAVESAHADGYEQGHAVGYNEGYGDALERSW